MQSISKLGLVILVIMILLSLGSIILNAYDYLTFLLILIPIELMVLLSRYEKKMKEQTKNKEAKSNKKTQFDYSNGILWFGLPFKYELLAIALAGINLFVTLYSERLLGLDINYLSHVIILLFMVTLSLLYMSIFQDYKRKKIGVCGVIGNTLLLLAGSWPSFFIYSFLLYLVRKYDNSSSKLTTIKISLGVISVAITVFAELIIFLL
jgi:hypothetical protein